jgi:pimeloyl-ACP methyl ester carboxylesterase
VCGRIPLVLLPGLLCDDSLWKHQVAALDDVADSRVMVMTEDDTMAEMAAKVLAQAPAKFALAGLSMGGYCAFEIMRQAPDRVVRLALLDTSHGADAPSRRSERLAWIAKAKLQGLEAMIPDHMAMWFHPEHLKDEALVAVAAQSARNVGLAAYERQLTAIMDRLDSTPTLALISCPTLVLCGRQDMATPLHLHEAMADGIEGAELVVVEDSGHLSTLEKPDVVSAALRRWLGVRV